MNPIRLSIFIITLWIHNALLGEVDFNRDIRPILSDKCFRCHGPDAEAREADLRLDLEDRAKGDLGGYSAIVPGDPDDSELIYRVTEDYEDEVMPPPKINKPVTPDEIAKLREWISEGAPYDTHWAFKPVEKQPIPELSNPEWCRNEIDYFILSQLEEAGLQPSAEANAQTLRRRVALDLTGLPPGSMVNDSNESYGTFVDRLMQSEHYGEHMAWRWLDAARYADSDGYESDPMRTMWPWRDWVVEAYNRHMPYDQFIVEQLAGDMLDDPDMRQILATGFNRNHRLNNEGGIDPEEWLIEYVADRAETTATVFMGLTLQCARCHDHKFDPISQKNYYEMFAYFHQLPELGSGRGATNAPPMMHVSALPQLNRLEKLVEQLNPFEKKLMAEADTAEFAAAHASWLKNLEVNEDAFTALPSELTKISRTKWSKDVKQSARTYFLRNHYEAVGDLRARMKPLEKKANKLKKTGAKVMVMGDMEEPRTTYILQRGSFDKPAGEVSANTPDFLPAMDASLPANRLGLAQWLVDPKHPLTARVAVNRLWESFFGIGLVKTSEDFGSQGEPPSHPKLLDYLAQRFIESGWNIQAMQKLIVSSASYRQSSVLTSDSLQRDPDNRLLARGPRYRLPAAVIRDQALAVSGLLVKTVGGPPVKPYQPEGLWKEVIKGMEEYERDTGEKLYRRSLYNLWRRAVKPPLLMILDANGRDTCSVNFGQTNTPLQALLLLNDVTFVETARAFAARMISEGGDTEAGRIAYGMNLLLNRYPSNEETTILVDELQSQYQRFEEDPEAAKIFLEVGEFQPGPNFLTTELAAYTSVARVLLNLDETLTKE
jgi:hypothetical protein